MARTETKGSGGTMTVNGREVVFDTGQMLLDVLRREGVRVTTLCHDERLTPYGGCRLCVVERKDGRGGLVVACSAPAEPGMVIESDTELVHEARRRQLQLLVLDHRMECPVCERSGDCRFQDLIYEIGTPEDVLPFDRVEAPRDDSSPIISRDPEKCIICGRCVRLCDEVQGNSAIDLLGRGLETQVATFQGRPLDCDFCGQCVNACPVGALVARPYISTVPAWLRESTTTTCSFCSCGCQIEVEHYAGHAERVHANEMKAPNRGKLCVKGWLGWDILDSEDRLRTPLVRRDGQLVEASWEEALDVAARGLGDVRDSGGTIAGFGSSRLACEDAYLFQRLLRDACASQQVGLGPTGGADALVNGVVPVLGRNTASFEDLADADLVLVLRADPGRTHPLIKTELMQGLRQRGQEMVLAHALSGGLERHATQYLVLNPGTEDLLLAGLARALLEKKPELHSERSGIEGFEGWADSLAAYTPDLVTAATGIQAAQLEELAGRLAAAERLVMVVVTGRGIPGDEAEVARAASQLALLIGAGVMVAGEKTNLRGVVEVGLHPELLPGYRPAGDTRSGEEVKAVTGALPAPGSGLSFRDTMQLAAAGEVDALYLMGLDPIGSCPPAIKAEQALEKTGFTIVQDAFLTPTAAKADVVLPVTILAERSGTLEGLDGRRYPMHRVFQPPAGLPQDGRVAIELARRLGCTLPSGDALTEEMLRLAGWDDPDDSVRRFFPMPAPRMAEPQSGIQLDAGPQLFHSGSVTARSLRLQGLSPLQAVRLNPADLRELGMHTGDELVVASNGRELRLKARPDRSVRRGTVVVPWHNTLEGAAGIVTGHGDIVPIEVRRSSNPDQADLGRG